MITQSDGDACFGCYPKSHLFHKEIIRGKGKNNWYILGDTDKEFLESKKLKFTRFTLKAGSMMLFYSRTAHSQANPIKTSTVQKLRMVHYVCMYPRSTDEKTYKKKEQSYMENRASNHWPNYSIGQMRLFSGKLSSFRRGDVSMFKKASRMDLTDMNEVQINLLGLERL